MSRVQCHNGRILNGTHCEDCYVCTSPECYHSVIKKAQMLEVVNKDLCVQLMLPVLR